MATLSILVYYIYIKTRTVLSKAMKLLSYWTILLPIERIIIPTIAWAQYPWIFLKYFFLTYGVSLSAILVWEITAHPPPSLEMSIKRLIFYPFFKILDGNYCSTAISLDCRHSLDSTSLPSGFLPSRFLPGKPLFIL